ncbi:hypothetical protein BJY18_007156 [Amycolatopsis jiangsuensis]|uniref:Uncharacterized protein n=1 Tax=Amycolatopsis jiangsuensis TaxID=1181879 RepID=A0A840J3M9_9PSEU|nr:hypothetical protein [Amycolatopsis jiangsuensis]
MDQSYEYLYLGGAWRARPRSRRSRSSPPTPSRSSGPCPRRGTPTSTSRYRPHVRRSTIRPAGHMGRPKGELTRSSGCAPQSPANRRTRAGERPARADGRSRGGTAAGRCRRRDHPMEHPQTTGAHKYGPAPALGCTLVIKSSPETALDAQLLPRIEVQAYLPDVGQNLQDHVSTPMVFQTVEPVAPQVNGLVPAVFARTRPGLPHRTSSRCCSPTSPHSSKGTRCRRTVSRSPAKCSARSAADRFRLLQQQALRPGSPDRRHAADP